MLSLLSSMASVRWRGDKRSAFRTVQSDRNSMLLLPERAPDHYIQYYHKVHYFELLKTLSGASVFSESLNLPCCLTSLICARLRSLKGTKLRRSNSVSILKQCYEKFTQSELRMDTEKQMKIIIRGIMDYQVCRNVYEQSENSPGSEPVMKWRGPLCQLCRRARSPW